MKKSLLSLAIAASLATLGGCGSSDSDSSSDDSGVSTSSYSGTVNKGIVSNGKVEICDVFDASGCITEDSSFYYETTTSDDGSYDVTDAPTDTPLLVLVSEAAEGDTTMKCDLASCNDDAIAFGDSFIVDSGWTLQAIIPAATSGTQTVNVTSLTDLATDEAFETAGNGRVTKTIAANANQAVQEAFGLSNDITEIGALDLTDADAVSEAINSGDIEEIMATTYSAVLMGFSEVDKDVIIEFNSETGGYTIAQGDTSTTTVLDTAYANASTLLETVETKINEELAESETVSLNTVIDKIDADADDIIEETTVIEAQDSTEIDEAKAFIQDVRTAYQSVQDEGDLSTGLEDFSDQFNDIDDLVSNDFDTISENIMQAVEAIADVYISEVYNAQTTSVNNEYTAYNGYVVHIDDGTYSVNEDNTFVSTTIVSANFSDEYTECSDDADWENGDSCVETGISSADIELTLDDVQVSVGETTLSATGGVVVSGFKADWNWAVNNTTSEWNNTSSQNTILDSANFSLDGTLAYSGGSSASFIGSIEFEFEGYEFVENDTYVSSSVEETYSGSDEGQESFTFDEAHIVFSGELIAPGSDSVGIYLSLRADNSLGYIEQFSWSNTWSCTWNSEMGGCTNTNDEMQSEETETVYVKAYAIARVTTELTDADGEAMNASIELNASRNEYDIIDTSISIDYNEVEIILQADIGLEGTDNSALTVRNTTGVITTMNALNDSDEALSGALTVNNVQVASIEETDTGLVLIRYTDGTFESLF